VDSEGPSNLLLQTPARDVAPAFSPDGRWLVYSSNITGRHEVYVMPYDRSKGGKQISIDGGWGPAWSPSGGEIYYRNGYDMMSVEIRTEPKLSAGRPRRLFAGRYLQPSPTRSLRHYDVSPDGERFLMIQSEEETGPAQFHLVLNWFDELERLVSTEN